MELRTIYVQGGRYTPVEPDAEYTTITRIVAAEGMMVTNGTIVVSVIDVPNNEVSLWSEIVAPPEELEAEQLITELESLV